MSKSSRSKKIKIIDIEEVEKPLSARNLLIMDMVKAGVPYAEVGKSFGLHAASISKIALQHGFSKKPHLLVRANRQH